MLRLCQNRRGKVDRKIVFPYNFTQPAFSKVNTTQSYIQLCKNGELYDPKVHFQRKKSKLKSFPCRVIFQVLFAGFYCAPPPPHPPPHPRFSIIFHSVHFSVHVGLLSLKKKDRMLNLVKRSR